VGQSYDKSNASQSAVHTAVLRGMSERSIESYGKLDLFDSNNSPDSCRNVGVMILDLFFKYNIVITLHIY